MIPCFAAIEARYLWSSAFSKPIWMVL